MEEDHLEEVNSLYCSWRGEEKAVQKIGLDASCSTQNNKAKMMIFGFLLFKWNVKRTF